MYAILTYSVFTALTATSTSVAELILWRSLLGLGLGGEWSAGSVLVSETFSPEHRGKAIGLMQSGWAIGYILAALLAAAILPSYGWRALFIAGVLPALLAVWIRRNVAEPDIWKPGASGSFLVALRNARGIFHPPLRRSTLLCSLLTTVVLFAYWGLFTWIPTFLSTPIERGGAGLGIVKSSGWIVPMQLGAFAGYTSFGFLADRFGRRPVFMIFLFGAGALVPVYGQLAQSELALLALGPIIGFVGHGYFSIFGVMLAEIFPTGIRGFAQGFTYNVGRAFSALAPFTIGALADSFGIGSALAVTSAFFLAGAGLIRLLPETKGKILD
jgi:MFS family permease